jgi:hypothetical protein
MWTKESFITSDRILAAFPSNYHKMDVFYSGGRPLSWRGRTCKPPPTSETLIVTGHSDFPIVESLLALYPRASWWGTNKQCARAHALPLGITNDTHESDLHPIYGNLDIMVEVAAQPRAIRNLVYMNFAVGTYPSERQLVWDRFASLPWVTVGTPMATLEGRTAFLSDIRNHSFVLCPRGNGVDTHRLWETLYMGSIPIVRWDIAHSDWTDLPIVFVRSWEDVTEEFLRKEEVRIQNTQWNTRKLHVQYWIDSIRNEARNNRDRVRFQPALFGLHP